MSPQSVETPPCDEVVLDIDKNLKSMNIQFSGITYAPNARCGENLQILKGVYGEFKSGHMTAIIGPSGSGKTSLLNVLNGFKRQGVTGKIYLNKQPINFKKFRQNSCFITQEFALLEYLTTKETLAIAADLKLPSTTTDHKKREVINKIVKLLGLQRCINNFVYNLSGGEKKRLSIGVELITNPSVMFFDEPTSGLDSVSSMQVIKHLRDLAHDGHTIIIVVHQPSSSLFQLFDDLYILTNGNCIYNGPLETMLDVFKQVGFNCPSYYNRADYALEVASEYEQNESNGLEQLISMNKMKSIDVTDYSNSLDGDERKALLNISTPPSPSSSDTASTLSYEKDSSDTSYPISEWRQVLVLTKRSFICTTRDLYFSQLRLVSHIIVGLLLGTVFYNVGNEASMIMTNLSCLFFFLLFIFFANTMPTVLTFPCETSVFFNQCFLNHWYSLRAYYVSKLIADLPLQLICPVLFVVIAYFMTGQPFECDRLMMLLAICILMAVMAHSLGLVAGAAFSVKHGVFLLPATSIPMLIFSGFFIRFNELIALFQPFTYLSYFRYGFEGSVRAIYGYNRTNLECSQIYCYYQRTDKFLQHMDMTNDTYFMDICGLLIWIVLLQICLYYVLKIKMCRIR